ncbi:MAG TPA: hypothetical protein VFX80_01375, partial [Solirubrobacteraceae bacterium]|nr:hypothetical protein [Solirubrobacteraceae bacterium]
RRVRGLDRRWRLGPGRHAGHPRERAARAAQDDRVDDTSEFLIAVAASLGFLIGLGGEAIDYAWVAALLAGGVIAAPDDVRYAIYASA